MSSASRVSKTTGREPGGRAAENAGRERRRGGWSVLPPSAGSFRIELRGRPGAGIAHAFDDGPDRVDHEFWLGMLDVVAALGCDDVPAVWQECGQLVLQRLPETLVRPVDA